MMHRKVLAVLAVAFGLMLALSVAGLVTAQANSGFLGINIEAVRNGVRVSEVVPDSPAATAGLQVGDVIMAVDGQSVTIGNVRQVLRGYQSGDTIQLDVQRDSATLQVEVTLADRPDQPASPELQPGPNRPYLGVRLEETDQGVVIQEVLSGSPADEAGLQIGDVLEKINDTDVTDAQSATDAIQGLEVGDQVTIQVSRNGETTTVEATLASRPPQPLEPSVPNVPFGGLSFTYNPQDQSWSIQNLGENDPLSEAGLQAGDVITQFNGEAYDPTGLHAFLMGLDDTATVTLTVERGGEAQELEVPASALGELDMIGSGNGFGFGGPGFGMPFNLPMMGNGRLGVEFQTLDEQVAQERNLDQTEGALIISVAPDSPASEAGIQADDIITAVNGEPVDAERTLRDRLLAYEPEDTVTLTVLRGSETLEIDATLGDQINQGMMPFELPVPTLPEENKPNM